MVVVGFGVGAAGECSSCMAAWKAAAEAPMLPWAAGWFGDCEDMAAMLRCRMGCGLGVELWWWCSLARLGIECEHGGGGRWL